MGKECERDPGWGQRLIYGTKVSPFIFVLLFILTQLTGKELILLHMAVSKRVMLIAYVGSSSVTPILLVFLSFNREKSFKTLKSHVHVCDTVKIVAVFFFTRRQTGWEKSFNLKSHDTVTLLDRWWQNLK